MNLKIQALSPKLTDNYLSLFDSMVFDENPDWSKCYCYSYHFTGPKEEWIREKNRDAVIKLIKENKMRGYLAFDGDKAIGWCNANEKNNFQLFGEANETKSALCSIVCFIISPEYRRKGIAQSLLERVCNDFKGKEISFIEAYPRKESHSCEKNYHGHLNMYKKLGFEIYKEFDEHYVVRKSL